MSLIPAGLLASLPDSLWPHTVTVKKTSIAASSNDEDSGSYAVVVAGVRCRFIPIKTGDVQLMDLYPSATHRLQLKGPFPAVAPTQFAFGDEGDGVQRRYEIGYVSTDGQGTIKTCLVERKGVV